MLWVRPAGSNEHLQPLHAVSVFLKRPNRAQLENVRPLQQLLSGILGCSIRSPKSISSNPSLLHLKIHRGLTPFNLQDSTPYPPTNKNLNPLTLLNTPDALKHTLNPDGNKGAIVIRNRVLGHIILYLTCREPQNSSYPILFGVCSVVKLTLLCVTGDSAVQGLGFRLQIYRV